MAIVTLPHTAKANTDANLFSETKANDQAIIDQVNGNLDATNIAADSIGTSEIAANIITQSEVSTSFITSGTYTPTLTNTTNITASTANADTMYFRVGSIVHVAGRVDIDPTGTGTVVLGISLPIASNFSSENQCAGTAYSDQDDAAAIDGSTANDTAILDGAVTDTTNESWSFTFTYRVI
jgi:hypothetical protein